MNLQDASGQDISGLDAVRRVRAASKFARLSAKADLESERGDDGALVASPAGSVSFHQRSPAIQQASFVTQLKKTLNAIPAFTWYKLPSGALAFVNERSGDYLGLAKDHPLRFGVDTDAAFDSHIFIIHPDDRDVARQSWEDCLRTQAAVEASFRIRNSKGEYRWFLVRAEPLRSDDGTLLYWVGISLDIEARKRAADKVAVQERGGIPGRPRLASNRDGADGGWRALATSEPISFGPFCVHRARRLIERNGETVPLGSRAFDILICLLEHAGQVVEKAELFRWVWPNSIVEEGNLRFHINALRKALGEGRYVANIAGRGYSFVAPVSRHSAEGMRSTSVRPFIDFTDVALRR
jgi:PAS domain S-box-containing protein